jgi:tyrosine-protein kinase Etk/Wzc
MEDREFQGIHLKDFVDVLIRRRWMFICAFLPLLLLVSIHTVRLYPVYQAITVIQMENEKNLNMNQANFGEMMWVDDKWFNTQMMILKGRVLAGEIVKKLGLQIQARPDQRIYQILFKRWLPGFEQSKFMDSPANLKLKPVEVSEGVRLGRYQAVFQDSRIFSVYDDQGREIGQGELGQPFPGPHFSFLLAGEGKPGNQVLFDIISDDTAAMIVQGKLDVIPVKNSNLLKVSAKWQDPITAANIANAAVEEYKVIIAAKKSQEASQVLSFIEEQLKATEAQLTKAEDELKKFKDKEKLTILDATMKNSLEQVTTYEKEFKTLETYHRQAEIVLKALQKRGPVLEIEGLSSLATGLNNPIIMDLGKKLVDLNIQRESLITTLKEQHPKVQAIDHEIDSVKRSTINEVKGTIASLTIRQNNLLESLHKSESKMQNLSSSEKELFSLERIVKVNQDVNSFLLQRRAEMNVNKGTALGNVWVVDPADVPKGFGEPDVLRRVMWGVIIGLAVGLCLIFFLEYLDTTIKTPEQLKKITSLPYLGTIYHASSSNKKEIGDLAILEAPYSHLAEAFRTIKTNILFSSHMEPKKFYLITSSGPNEGKTFITSNLAATLAQSGKRVLIVEADLRNAGMVRIWGGNKSPGLSNVLLDGQMDFSAMPIHQTVIENLNIILAGDTPPNPSELLGSEVMDQFLSVVGGQYDFVFIDSPPAFLTSDPLVLAQKTEGVIFVARSGEVQENILRETLARFSRLKSTMLGVIFNDMNREGTRYYSYKYTYYYDDGGHRIKKKTRVSTPRRPTSYPVGGQRKIEQVMKTSL